MSYVKLCQICDKGPDEEKLDGLNYVETYEGFVVKANSIAFPLVVSIEVIDFGTLANFSEKGFPVQFNQEVVTVPNNSISIRDFVFNQLLEKYPNLVK